jgi:hypothetical protein
MCSNPELECPSLTALSRHSLQLHDPPSLTRYLDEDLRIGRGPGRELYVLSKRDARATADAAVQPRQ